MESRDFTVTIKPKEGKDGEKEAEGRTIALRVVSPTLEVKKEGEKVYNNAFTEALQSKAVVRARLDDLLVEQGLWDESKQQNFETLQKELSDRELTLKKGGISLQKAKEIALEMKKKRLELRELISVKTDLDTHTAEGQADNAKFNYYVYACTYKDNQKYYSSYKDYQERAGDEESVAAAQNLANMIYGLDQDYEKKLPENKFLLNYRFVNDKMQFINKEGKTVDSEGRLVNEEGRFINEEGKLIDKYGNAVTKDGEYEVDFLPFLDENGNPVDNATAEPEESETSTEENSSEENTEGKKAVKKTVSKKS